MLLFIIGIYLVLFEKYNEIKLTPLARLIKKQREKNQINKIRNDQPVISSLSVLHHPKHTKRFTELGREEKGEGGDRGDLVEKKENPKWERASQASNLAPK